LKASPCRSAVLKARRLRSSMARRSTMHLRSFVLAAVLATIACSLRVEVPFADEDDDPLVFQPDVPLQARPAMLSTGSLVELRDATPSRSVLSLALPGLARLPHGAFAFVAVHVFGVRSLGPADEADPSSPGSLGTRRPEGARDRRDAAMRASVALGRAGSSAKAWPAA